MSTGTIQAMSPTAIRRLKTKIRNRPIESLAIRDLAAAAEGAGQAAHAQAIARGYRATRFVDGKLMYVYPDGHMEPFPA